MRGESEPPLLYTPREPRESGASSASPLKLPRIPMARSASEGAQVYLGHPQPPRVSAAPGAAAAAAGGGHRPGRPSRPSPPGPPGGSFYSPPGLADKYTKKSVPSSLARARAYAASNVPKPKPGNRSPRRESGADPPGGGMDGRGGGGRGGGRVGQQQSKLFDGTQVDFQGFVAAAAATADCDKSDASFRRRFEELRPDAAGKIYLQDYRLTLLFESLSRARARVLDLFRDWDADDSASVDRKEFHKGLRKLGFTEEAYSNADLDAVFDHLDEDSSGSIDYVELNAKLRPKTVAQQAHKLRTSTELRRGAQKQIATRGKRKKLQRGPGAPPIAEQLQGILRANYLKVLDVFKMYDTNDDGTVDMREFSDGLTALGYDAPREEFDDLFASFDKDGSGSIDYYELYQQLRAGRKNFSKPPPRARKSSGGGGDGGKGAGGDSAGVDGGGLDTSPREGGHEVIARVQEEDAAAGKAEAEAPAPSASLENAATQDDALSGAAAGSGDGDGGGDADAVDVADAVGAAASSTAADAEEASPPPPDKEAEAPPPPEASAGDTEVAEPEDGEEKAKEEPPPDAEEAPAEDREASAEAAEEAQEE